MSDGANHNWDASYVMVMPHLIEQETGWYWNVYPDDQGSYVLAKSEWISPLLNVDEGEALGLCT